jgi:hypothetical protein
MRSARAGAAAAAAAMIGTAAIACWASAGGNLAADVGTYRFSGRLQVGQRFERRFADSLRFVLEPADVSGWSIQILQRDTLADYAGIATPPFHGPNPTQIEAWHFRNQDNTGPSRGPWPGAEREFSFVTTRRDYQAAAAALDVMLWPNGRSDGEVDSARAVFDALPTGRGRLRITDMRLGDLGAGRPPRFEAMRFHVELVLPARR